MESEAAQHFVKALPCSFFFFFFLFQCQLLLYLPMLAKMSLHSWVWCGSGHDSNRKLTDIKKSVVVAVITNKHKEMVERT